MLLITCFIFGLLGSLTWAEKKSRHTLCWLTASLLLASGVIPGTWSKSPASSPTYRLQMQPDASSRLQMPPDTAPSARSPSSFTSSSSFLPAFSVPVLPDSNSLQTSKRGPTKPRQDIKECEGPRGQSTCPSGTFAHISRNQWNCYKFYEERLTFEEAELECQLRWRGHLASFNSNQQAKSVAVYVTKENMESPFVWIGLRRNEGSSMNTGWRWVDGSRSRYRKWRKTEPNGNDEYCVGLHAGTGHVTWNELDCSRELPFLCKWKPTEAKSGEGVRGAPH